MGFISWIKKIFSKPKDRVIIKKYTSEEQIKDYPAIMEKNRQFLLGELNAAKAKIKQLESERKKEKPKIANVLAKQQKAIQILPFLGGLSLRNMFDMHFHGGLTKKSQKDYKVVSSNFMRNFGNFHDIVILKDGRIAIYVRDDKGLTRPIITGSTTKDIFYNFGGLIHSVGDGFMILNLNEEGKIVENTMQKDIPKFMIDAKGKYYFNDNNYQPFIEQLTEANDTIAEQDEYIATITDASNQMSHNDHIIKLQSRLQKNRADVATNQKVEVIEEANEMRNRFSELEKSNAIISNEQKVDQKILEKVEDALTKTLEKISVHRSKTDYESAKKTMQDDVTWFIEIYNQIQGESMSPDQIQSLIETVVKNNVISQKQNIPQQQSQRPEEKISPV